MISMPVLRPISIPTKHKDFSFLQKAKVWLTNPRTFRLEEDWLFEYNLPCKVTTRDGTQEPSRSRNVNIVVPKGFVFDGASVPRCLHWFLSPFGILMVPGLVHDYLYKFNHLIISDSASPTRFNPQFIAQDRGQRYADQLFYDIAVKVNGMKLLSFTAYFALRVFGGIAWKKHRDND